MDAGGAASLPLFSFFKNHYNELPGAAEGSDFLCRAVVTINKQAYIQWGTVHWGNSKQLLAAFYVCFSFFFFSLSNPF